MLFKTVAVGGATSKLGPSIVNKLISAGFDVTILSRTGDAYKANDRVTRVVKVDYESLHSLTNALRGQDAFVSILPNQSNQILLIDAAIAAGVKRFIPSEYGANSWNNAKVAAMPLYSTAKIPVQRHLEKHADKISYTPIVSGLFLDWGLKTEFIVKFKEQARLFDHGENRFSATTLADIGQAVVGVLTHPDETKNRPVFVQSASLTQNQLLDIAERLNPETKPNRNYVDTDQMEKDAYAKLRQGDRMAMVDFILLSIFGQGVDSDYSAKNDSELLGVVGLTDRGLEELIGQVLSGRSEDMHIADSTHLQRMGTVK